ncbi:MAG: V-type ATP synthase subunit D [Gammaproteobacteria bacterium]|jgi:V/A-type H+-transporting ATPase subunit D
MAERVASRAALLELRRDRSVFEEGHRFLDEKRMLVARELLRRLADYQAMVNAFEASLESAAGRMAAGLAHHGLEGLQVYPAAAVPVDERLMLDEGSFLGVKLLSGRMPVRGPVAGTVEPAVLRSAQAEAVAGAFSGLLDQAVPMAVELANILRLHAEYRLTERRVRSLENLILPEIRADQRRMEAALEELDQEEMVRGLLFGGRDEDRTGGE